MLFDFVDGGALDEVTRGRNRDAYDRWYLKPGVLRPTEDRDQSVEIFGHRLRSPVMLAPTGGSGLLWPRGECEAARAAGESGTVMCVSAGATQTIEAVAAAGEGPKWLQLFVYRDRSLTEQFIGRATASGYHALCLTVDAPVSGRRERDLRNGFSLNPKPSFGTIVDTLRHIGWWLRMARQPRVSLPNFRKEGTADFVSIAAYAASVLSSTVTFDDVRWVRGLWAGPLVVKGVLEPEDASRLVDLGVDGIQVSNHGGRQFDGVPGTLEMLPAVVAAVGGRVPVFLDGGIRRGTDVLKAVALGAKACCIGRAHLWGLASKGGEGVKQVLDILFREIDQAMAYGGWQTLSDVHAGSVLPYPPGR